MIFERNEKMIGKYHAAVRAVLQHHKLTEVGNGVVEADLVEAVLTVANTDSKVIGSVDVMRGGCWVNVPQRVDIPSGKYSLVAVDLTV